MPDDANYQILKILSGSQNGVEVALEPGDYGFGSGPEDDLQFTDLAVRTGHGRVRLQNGTIQIKTEAGAIETSTGLKIDIANDEWHEVDQLDIITVGTTLFAIGSISANWADVVGFRQGEDKQSNNAVSHKPKRQRKPDASSSAFKFALFPLLLLAGAFIIGWWAWAESDLKFGRQLKENSEDNVAELRKAINKLAFARNVIIRQEVDGVIYAQGHVDSLVQRRAVRQSIAQTQIPVRTRIWVNSAIRNELKNLIQVQDLNVEFTLGDAGGLELRGSILSPAAAKKFTTLIRNEVLGVVSVQDKIKTFETYLTEVKALASLSQIGSSVLIRLDNSIIEATGVVESGKLDAWVGFLQSYRRRFADIVPLRSFVTLENKTANHQAAGTGASGNVPIIIAGPNFKSATAGLAGRRLIREDLEPTNGTAPKTVFANSSEIEGERSLAIGSDNSNEAGGNDDSPDVVKEAPSTLKISLEETLVSNNLSVPISNSSALKALPAPTEKDQSVSVPDNPRSGTKAEKVMVTPEGTSFEVLKDAAKILSREMTRTMSDEDVKKIDDLDLTRSMKNLKLPRLLSKAYFALPDGQNSNDSNVKPKLPISATNYNLNARHFCWPGARLSSTMLPSTLLWMDVLSSTRKYDIADIGVGNQRVLLEAALSPDLVKKCLSKVNTSLSRRLNAESLFLQEASRNPNFVLFLLRKIQRSSIDISGTNLAGNRYIELRDGRKLNEGAAPSPTNRLVHIGELGVLLRVESGYTVKVYNDDLAWFIDTN